MLVFIRRRAGLLVVPVALLLAGCGRHPAAPAPANVTVAQAVPTEPGEIALSDAKVTFAEPNMVRFEVSYRFTKGKPDKYYMCEISFPGTPNHGAKSMESWELKSEGVIKDGIVLHKPPVKTFEIHVSEAESPQNGYKTISNVLGGPVK